MEGETPLISEHRPKQQHSIRKGFKMQHIIGIALVGCLVILGTISIARSNSIKSQAEVQSRARRELFNETETAMEQEDLITELRAQLAEYKQKLEEQEIKYKTMLSGFNDARNAQEDKYAQMVAKYEKVITSMNGSLSKALEGGWSKHGSYAYKIFYEQVEFNTAESTCQIFQSHLASIHNNEEANVVWDLIKDDVRVDVSGLWIGLFKKPFVSWRWTDGTSVNYLNWVPGEPEDWTSTGAMVKRTETLNWVGLSTGSRHGFLCKKIVNV